MWPLSLVSCRSSLQWDPSVIWLWPGALRGAPASPRPSILYWISVLLATTPIQEPEQPRHPVFWLSGVHTVGNVTWYTSTNVSERWLSLSACSTAALFSSSSSGCSAVVLWLLHCPSLPSLHTPSHTFSSCGFSVCDDKLLLQGLSMLLLLSVCCYTKQS